MTAGVDRSTTAGIVAIALAGGAILWLQATHSRAMPTIDRSDAIVLLVLALQAATWLLWSRSMASATWMAAQAALVIACGVILLDGPTRSAVANALLAAVVAAVGRLVRSGLRATWEGIVASLLVALAVGAIIALA